MSIAEMIAEGQKQVVDNWGWLIVIGYICASLIEVSPVKIYPLKYIKKKILMFFSDFVKEINREMFEKINQSIDKINEELGSIRNDLIEYRKEQKFDKIKILRKEILTFADDLSNNKEFSKRSYEEILFTTYIDYEKLIEETGSTNGLVNSSIDFIKEKYEKHLRDGGFALEEY